MQTYEQLLEAKLRQLAEFLWCMGCYTGGKDDGLMANDDDSIKRLYKESIELLESKHKSLLSGCNYEVM